MDKKLTIALAGNPNSGKTTIFNNLTGARQHVGNYPGVTVEKKEGTCTYDNTRITIVDLPGTYSLTAYSIEEIVARNFIADERPDVVVDIIDSTNIERNLYLAVQIAELGVPLVLAFNMSDCAKTRGIEFDIDLLSSLLRVPIVRTVGNKGKGMDELLKKAYSVAVGEEHTGHLHFSYGKEIESAIERVSGKLESVTGETERLRWTAVKLLENDREVCADYEDSDLIGLVEEERKRLEDLLGDTVEMIIADMRYGFISGACTESVRTSVERRHETSDRIDSVLTNRIIGLPIFLGLMYLVFWVTFTLGGPPMEWLTEGFGWLAGTISGWWPAGSESILKSLLIDGIIGGVGGVLVFLPNIMLLFLAIAILEDSGYMARAAFIMDRLMHKIGLHGKSFIPMLIGFGCSVPAIMATRTLENRRDRLTTMLVLPLISCGARLPIYALIIPVFFPEVWHARMLWIIYTTGILLAIVSAKLLRSTLFKGETAPFVMELPPYRMPTLKSVTIHMWDRGFLYLKKAGTIILGISVVLWALTSFPRTDFSGPDITPEEEHALRISSSYAGRIGHILEPVLKPIGFDWKIGTALIGAFAAKEVFVAQLGIVYSLGEADEESEDLREKLKYNYSPLIGLCIMLFSLISAPCMATIAVTKRESNSWKWAMFQLGGLTLLAYVVTFAVYQTGMLLGLGV